MLIAAIILIAVAVFAFIVFLSKRPKPTYTPEEKPGAYQNQAQPRQGALKNVRTRFQAKSDAKTQAVANVATAIATEGIRLTTDAVSADLENKALPERYEQTLKKETADTNAYISAREAEQQESELKKLLIAHAVEEGLPLGALERLLEKEKLDNLEIKKLQKETVVKLEAGFIYQLREYHKIMMLRKELDGLYVEIDQIQNSQLSEYVKTRQVDEREADIKAVQEDRRGRRQRLLSAFDGDDDSGSGEDAEY